MKIRAAVQLVFVGFVSLFLLGSISFAQSTAAGDPHQNPDLQDADLQFVVALSRHGVRSPIGNTDLLNKYSAAPWPKWDVPPSYLTPHGFALMKLFGVWDRVKFSGDGLFAPTGCADAAHVTILADSDERTRETGKALAEGMFPGCPIEVHAKAEGVEDSLYRVPGGLSREDKALAAAAVAGRIGGNPNLPTEAFRPQLAALDQVLAGCGHAAPTDEKRTSIFEVPVVLGAGSNYASGYRGPLTVASTMAENILLEYTTGMSDANTGWGCVNGAKLRELMQLDTASWEYGFRTQTIARIYASNLLDRIERSLRQSVMGKPVDGALSKPGDRLLIVVGHDTNIVTVAGALGVSWIIDGRVDDTPPGGALLFELWRPRKGGKPFVRLEYTAQTLEQMRQLQPLTTANPPAAAPIFVPGCSAADKSCTWEGFAATVRAVVNPAYVSVKP
jgi:4-phytase / acid phosphatase